MILRKGIFNSFLLNDLCLLCFIIEAHGFLGSIHSENDFQRKYLIRKPFYNKPFLNDFSLYTQRDSNRIVIWLALQDVTTWKIGENTCQNTTREKWLNFTSLRTGITSQESQIRVTNFDCAIGEKLGKYLLIPAFFGLHFFFFHF